MSYIFTSVLPLPCINQCVCSYSVHDGANTMDCSDQGMVDFPGEIQPLTDKLILSGNNIKHLQNMDNNLTQVKQLDFENNDIDHISNKSFKMLLSNVNKLNLKRNNLRRLPILLQTSTKTQLWLGHNPYKCNCDMMWMRDWLQNATNVMDKDNITCGPGKWKGE